MKTLEIEQKKISAENCAFCKILSGEFAAIMIYRDQEIAAFLDIQPLNPGHVLVIPVKHAVSLGDLESSTGAKMWLKAVEISSALRKSGIQCEGINLFLADGKAAGQEVWHAHLHIFPRYNQDGIQLTQSKDKASAPSRLELNSLAQLVKGKL